MTIPRAGWPGVLLVRSVFATPAPAQSGVGGFLGLDARFGDVTGAFAAFVGAEAAVVLHHRAYLGLRGAGLATTNHRIPADSAASSADLGMGYGGFVVGYAIPVRGPIAVTVDVLTGAGAVGVRASPGDGWDPVFLFEPSLTVDLLLASVRRIGARIGIGAAYRYVGDVDVSGLREQDLRGFAGVVRLRVGRF